MRNDGRLYVTCGASRSGKTALTMQECASAARLIVWDPKGTWARDCRCEKITDPRALVRRVRPVLGPLRVALVCPDPAAFDLWAGCAFWWGRVNPCVAVAEEIAAVTAPGKAPGGWHLLLSQGLEFGIDIHAITQSISESDKTCVRNASALRTFLLPFPSDRKYMSQVLDVPLNQVEALGKLEYFSRDMKTLKTDKKRLNFARNRAPKAPPPIK